MLNSQTDPVAARKMIEQAIQMVADIKFQGDRLQTAAAIQSGRCDICISTSSFLVNQISHYLGQLDRSIKAVYQVTPDMMPIPHAAPGSRARTRPTGINLIVWVERKSAALSALVATFEKSVSQGCQQFSCQEALPDCFMLDIQTVDNEDVLLRRGFGTLIRNRFCQTAVVWEREHADLFREDAIGVNLSIDPEILPESILFEQVSGIEMLPKIEQETNKHHLMEIKVALIRRLISDQLAYIHIAKEWLTFGDLKEIYQKRIGNGRIGGKAAGMVLAHRILRETLDESMRNRLKIPDSYYMGSDVIYIFMAMNGLMHWNNQKYKTEDLIRAEYPLILEEFQKGEFPPEVLVELSQVLDKIGRCPIIVRSSSLLEDNFGASFAGKYESIFLPNQADAQTNLNNCSAAIARIFASTFRPDALMYRRSKGLQDYDERMAILIQCVQGERYGPYYFPLGAGVAFSRNLYRWSQQIRKEDGFVRLVWGLGTRAVERVGDDYPRLVALSHPTLQPDDTVEAIRYYAQKKLDVIDLEQNKFQSLPVQEVLKPDTTGLRYIAQVEEEGYFSNLRSRIGSADLPRLVITFDELLRRTPFATTMMRMLNILESRYHAPVDVEFTVKMANPDLPGSDVQINLLQCRPQSLIHDKFPVIYPQTLVPEDVIFSTHFMVPRGFIPNVRWVLFISPEGYFQLPTEAARRKLRQLIASLNSKLNEKSYICVGPGRWGTINPDLGVFVSYSDIDHAAALVELSGKSIGPVPDPSLGTHFFQDLMEANIYPLSVCLDHAATIFNHEFFYGTQNDILDWLIISKEYAELSECVKLIDIEAYRPGSRINLLMDDEQGQALAYMING